MKRIYLLLIYVFCCGALSAQSCLPNGITFTTQEEIDSFAVNYPGCTEIIGNVTVGTNTQSTITNLDGLNQIESIRGNLRIADNDYLIYLTGLDNLTSVHNLYISYNNALRGIKGLERLQAVYERLSIQSNDALGNMNGLTNLKWIGRDIYIFNNNSLTCLPEWNDLYIHKKVTISFNDNLSLCSTDGICRHLNRLAIFSYAEINNNASGCNSKGQVSSNCMDTYCDNQDCPTGDITFATQQEIDDFAVNYPLCKDLSAGLTIEDAASNSINNLDGLDQITSINGSLNILNNENLSSLVGLKNIDNSGIDSLNVHGNTNLSNCEILNICDYLHNNQAVDIHDNAANCNSVNEIVDICNSMLCFPDGIVFSTQTQIDSFVLNYPDCETIMGDIVIRGDSSTSITNLNKLSPIVHIRGALIIENNGVLSSLEGLNQVTTIDRGLSINNNDALIDITDLINAIRISGELSITNNNALTTLEGLDNMCPAAIDWLRIEANHNLSFCGIQSICRYVNHHRPLDASNDFLVIQDNLSLCSSPVSISYSSINCAELFLPIELTTFQAQIQNKTALLTWQTAIETHNSGFEIQRSKDGTTWEKIGWQDGQGDTQTTHDYTHRDENLLFGTSYYRLKQIDFDGTFSYSDVVSVKYIRTDISIYPNPVKNILYIADLNGQVIQNSTIFDQMGRQVILQNSTVNTLDVSALPSGLYIIKVTLDNDIFSDKFIVR